MPRTRFLLGMSLIATPMFGCDGRDLPPTAQGSVVHARDSGGVQHLEVDWRGLIERSEVPSLRVSQVIGSIDAPGVLLHGVVGVVSVGGNRWIIGQSRAPYLLLVSDETIQASAGRQGEGPGEFRRLDWIGAMPDGRIAAHSGLDHTLAWFAPDLMFEGEQRLDPEAWSGMGYLSALSIEGVTSDGEFVGSAMKSRPGDGRLPLGWSRPERGLLSLHPDMSVREVGGGIPGDEVYGWDSDCPAPGGCRGFNDQPPLQKRVAVQVAGDLIYVMDTGEGVVEVRDVDGRQVRRIHFAPEWLEPTPGQIDRAVAAHMATINASSNELRERIERNVREHAAPGPPPVLHAFAVGGPDELWFQFDPGVVPEADGLLVRVDTSELEAATYRMPRGFSLMGADEHHAWGVVTDELDVQYVYVLHRP